MEKEYAVYLPEDNSQPTLVEFKRGEDGLMDLRWCYEQIGNGCDLVEIVNTEIPHLCIVCDEEFLYRNEPKLNIKASMLYGAYRHGQPICGNVLLCKDQYTEDGLCTVGFTEEEAKGLLLDAFGIIVGEVDED